LMNGVSVDEWGDCWWMGWLLMNVINNYSIHQQSLHSSTITPFINNHSIHQQSLHSSTITPFINNHSIHQQSPHSSTITPFINTYSIHQQSLHSSTLTMNSAFVVVLHLTATVGSSIMCHTLRWMWNGS
jgi:hypothetical protein